MFKILYSGTIKSSGFLFFVLKTMITSLTPVLNLEITSTPSIEEFPKRMGVNTKMFMTLDWSIPLVLNIKSPNANKPNDSALRRIVYEKQH